MSDLTAITERTEYYDIVLESEEIFHLSLGAADIFLGMQFYQEEPVQLWARDSDIYLYRTGGSGELKLQDVAAGGDRSW